MSTGFTPQRAEFHDLAAIEIFDQLGIRGYQPERLDVSGDRPDLRIRDADGSTALVEIKTGYRSETGQVAIKLACLENAFRSPNRVYFVFADTPRVPVHTHYTMLITGGPKRPTGNGSNTGFVLVKPLGGRGMFSGVPFEDYFQEIKSKQAAA